MGGIGLKPEGKKIADLGYFVGKKFQGKGVATTAAEKTIQKAKELGFIGLKATTHPMNIPSQKVLTKSGFTLVGRMERYMEIRQEFQPRLLYWLPLTE